MPVCYVTATVKRIKRTVTDEGDSIPTEVLVGCIRGRLFHTSVPASRNEAIPGTVNRDKLIFSVPTGSPIELNDIVYLPENRVTGDPIRTLVNLSPNGYPSGVQVELEAGTMQKPTETQ